jgi:hypothetical protein
VGFTCSWTNCSILSFLQRKLVVWKFIDNATLVWKFLTHCFTGKLTGIPSPSNMLVVSNILLYCNAVNCSTSSKCMIECTILSAQVIDHKVLYLQSDLLTSCHMKCRISGSSSTAVLSLDIMWFTDLWAWICSMPWLMYEFQFPV